MWNEDWSSKALCNETRPDVLFVRGAAQNRAKQMCAGCPV
jgi:WhiB family redox-sensing transcriptional regulator